VRTGGCLERYFSTWYCAGRRRGRLLEVLLAPVEGAGPEDLREYEYEDVGS